MHQLGGRFTVSSKHDLFFLGTRWPSPSDHLVHDNRGTLSALHDRRSSHTVDSSTFDKPAPQNRGWPPFPPQEWYRFDITLLMAFQVLWALFSAETRLFVTILNRCSSV